jgi:hypothetical protein
VNYEIGYQGVHKGPDGWLTGLVIGHDFTPKLEGDVEFYNQGTFHPSENQPTIDFGGRYKIHSSVIFLFMAGRSLEPARSNQSSFVISGSNFCFRRNRTNPVCRKTRRRTSVDTGSALDGSALSYLRVTRVTSVSRTLSLILDERLNHYANPLNSAWLGPRHRGNRCTPSCFVNLAQQYANLRITLFQEGIALK